MTADSTAAKQNAGICARDPFDEARKNLFPLLRNGILARAAGEAGQGQTDKAMSLVVRYLKKKPADPAALNLMADIARRSQRFDEAERLLLQCVHLSPESVGYRFNLVVILRRREKYEDALLQAGVLLKQNPGNPLFLDQKAAILSLLGRHIEALAYRQDLSARYPCSPKILLDHGRALRAVGSTDESIATYRRALALEPALTAAYSLLADLKTCRFTDTEIEHMQRLVRSGLSTEERADLHSALGRAYEDEKQYAKAFENHAKANALRRLRCEFDSRRLSAHRTNCERIFTGAFFRERQGWGCKSAAPIFIVGMPRSGTTLIEQMLASHSTIEGLGERPDFDLVVGRLLSSKEGGRPAHDFWIGGWLEFRDGLIEAYPRVINALTSAEAQSVGQDYLESTRTRRSMGRQFFTDKALRNFGYVGLIQLVLPNAKIIDVRRHPLDCGWSCFKSHFPDGQPFADSLGDIGQHYANYARLMSYFDKTLPGRIHRILYEDLVENPEAELHRLFDYLELPFEPQCLRFHENKRIAETISSEQVRTPLYKGGLAQWRPYEQWLGPLKAALGETLQEYGYDPH